MHSSLVCHPVNITAIPVVPGAMFLAPLSSALQRLPDARLIAGDRALLHTEASCVPFVTTTDTGETIGKNVFRDLACAVLAAHERATMQHSATQAVRVVMSERCNQRLASEYAGLESVSTPFQCSCTGAFQPYI